MELGYYNVDLWPPKPNQFITESNKTFVQKLKKFLQSVLQILLSWDWAARSEHEVTATLTFKIWPARPNQFITESKFTFVPSLKESPPSITLISCSQEWMDGRMDKQTTWRHNACGPGWRHNITGILGTQRVWVFAAMWLSSEKRLQRNVGGSGASFSSVMFHW